MALTFPVPNDATYDYVPITGTDVQVGMDLLSLWSVQGEVSYIDGPPDSPSLWVFLMDTFNPDGTGTYGTAVFPTDTSGLPDNWWGRTAIWKRTAKLSDGGSYTAGDGSKWRYPANEDGRMVCTHAGTTYTQGTRKFRGELTTDPRDLWICDDADWDWLPIADGSEVSLGDTITFLLTITSTVDTIDVTETDEYRRSVFLDASSQQIGWWDVVFAPQALVAINVWTFFQRLSKPSTDTSFRAPDGSRWDYVGSSLYYCWGRGITYAPGAIFYRGGVAGGLTAIT